MRTLVEASVTEWIENLLEEDPDNLAVALDFDMGLASDETVYALSTVEDIARLVATFTDAELLEAYSYSITQ